MAQSNPTIFVSHSFDEKDHELCDALIALLKRHKFRVITAEAGAPGRFSDKIKNTIAAADITLGIFTRRHKSGQRSPNGYLPPAYVISECAYALGAYCNTSRSVYGFVETGIPYDALGLPTADGQDFPRFDRKEVLGGETQLIEQFLKRLKKTIQLDQSKQPYIQEHVRKTVEVYRSGAAIVKNKVTALIRNGETIVRAGGLDHTIWLSDSTVNFPDMAALTSAAVSPRFTRPFFYAALLKVNDKDNEQCLGIDRVKNHGNRLDFLLRFPITLKSNDRIEYQYVWGVENAYLTSQEELDAKNLEYQEVAIKTNHGEIRSAELRLKFERANVHGSITELFGKSPYVVLTPSTSDDAMTYMEPLTPKRTLDSVFITYEYSAEKIDGALRMRWIPAKTRTEAGIGVPHPSPSKESPMPVDNAANT